MKRLAMERVEWRRKHRPRRVVCPNFMKGMWFVVVPSKKAQRRLVRQWATLARDRVTSLPMLERPDRHLLIAEDLPSGEQDVPRGEVDLNTISELVLHTRWGWGTGRPNP